MPAMRLGVSSLLWSLLRIVCFTAALCVGRGFIMRAQAPQTPQQTEARDLLNQGVQAFKNGRSDDAARLFEQAKNLDPNLLNARLYLATAYASQYIPGAPSEENHAYGQHAVEEFRAVLQLDPQNLSAIDGIGAILFQMAATPRPNSQTTQSVFFDQDLARESKSFHEKHLQLKPQDPEPYYWIGVIDWTLSYRADRELRAQYNQSAGSRKVADADALPPALQARYAEEWTATIDEGIASLKKAIQLRPDYDDAMAYLNLLYRRKADAASTEYERGQLNKTADDLVDQVMQIKRQRAQAQAPQH